VDFEVEHVFSAPVDDVVAALLDKAFQESLSDIGALESRTLLSQEERTDGSVARRVRCVLDIDVQGPARRFIGDGDPAWVEESVWDPGSQTWRWEIQPEVGANLLAAHGETMIRAHGEHALRRVTGTVKVSVPLYGGKVEGWIVEGIEQAYDEEAERLAGWLSS
jgi:hypothetical protein